MKPLTNRLYFCGQGGKRQREIQLYELTREGVEEQGLVSKKFEAFGKGEVDQSYSSVLTGRKNYLGMMDAGIR